jgi:hypothetical protein
MKGWEIEEKMIQDLGPTITLDKPLFTESKEERKKADMEASQMAMTGSIEAKNIFINI